MMAYSDQNKNIQALARKNYTKAPITIRIMKKIALTVLSFSLFLSIGISVNLEEASAQNTSIPYDMQAIKNGIGDSLSKLTGTNSSNLLSKTLVLINETASRLANDTTDTTNGGSLQQAEIIGKKIAIGIADVLGNISGEVKQGFEIK
jgi:hypothetical protein